MNDFFTELDSDILGTVKAPENFNNFPIEQKKTFSIPENNNKKSPAIHNSPKKIHTPSQKNNKIPVHVTEMRSQMMNAWVVVIVFKADEKTWVLLGHLKLETRGFVYLDEIREIHKVIIKKARASYEDTMKDIPDIEEKELIKIIRRDLEIFLLQRTEKNPVIIPIILYI